MFCEQMNFYLNRTYLQEKLNLPEKCICSSQSVANHQYLVIDIKSTRRIQNSISNLSNNGSMKTKTGGDQEAETKTNDAACAS